MEYTNGTTEPGRLRGRAAPVYPTLTLKESGYTITMRRLSAGTAAQLTAKAAEELAVERPTPPVQVVEVAPPERPGGEPVTKAVEHTSDPDYVAALRDWQARVNTAGALKLMRLIQDYAIVTPTDEEAVGAYREAMGAVGVEVAGDDREVFVWSIVAPTQADQQQIVAFVMGLSEAQMEAVQAHRASFRGGVSGPPAGAVEDAPGPEPV